ncbi:MAG: DUF4922 domain-containing protein [Spirochaetales bacterium]|nr:DUF4922 domain-containing protein [Spirochaetales bacterium]
MEGRPGPDAAQNRITTWLKEIRTRDGLEAAMEALRSWSFDSGYIDKEKLEKNTLTEYYDSDYDLSFSYQINYARSGYTPRNNRKLPPGAECLICRENAASPGKETLRVLDLKIRGEKEERDFFLQLTPFPLFPRHYVLIDREHTPMNMGQEALSQCLAFTAMAPGCTVCSNSDLQWAGASILSHSHYQILPDRRLPVMDAASLFRLETDSGILMDALDFPMPALRFTSLDRTRIQREAGRCIGLWKETASGYRTVNMLCSRSGEAWMVLLILRDSRNRNPEELQKYKSEGIGVLEAAGSWIFPPPADYPEEELTRNSRNIIRGFFKGIRPFDPRNKEDWDFLPHRRIDYAHTMD